MAPVTAPRPGTVYGFATEPWSRWNPVTGRFGALKVLKILEPDHWVFPGAAAFGVLGGVFDHLPDVEEVAGLPLLAQYRFDNFHGALAVYVCDPAWFDGPELLAIGIADVTPRETEAASSVRSVTAPESARGIVEGEWRWAHDREALEADSAREEEEDTEKRRVEQERFETRLKDLTWEQLLSEQPFERWDPSPPFPTAEFTAAATDRVHEAMRELAEAGPKPSKKVARATLKRLVTWLNQADQAAGNPIETEEREDVVRVLGEMAFVARHPSLINEIDGWRTW
jgi:hypothetical protein